MWGQGATLHPRAGIQASEERHCTRPWLLGKTDAERGNSTADCRTKAEECECDAEKEHGKANIIRPIPSSVLSRNFSRD